MQFIENNISTIIVTCCAVAALCVAGIIFLLARSSQNKNTAKEYDLRDNQLWEHKNRGISYEKIADFLEANGAKYHYPFMANPVRFVFFSILLAAIFCVVGGYINFVLGLIGVGVGLILPYLLIKYKNKKDNEIILGDIKTIYDVLYNQMTAGVYVSAALMECSSGYGSNRMIKNPRLLAEMKQLSADIYLNSNVNEALERFTKKFDNIYLISLAVVVNQSLESGLASDALKDITEQLKEVERNLLILKRERKQIKNFIFELFFLFGIVITMFSFIFPTIASRMASL